MDQSNRSMAKVQSRHQKTKDTSLRQYLGIFSYVVTCKVATVRTNFHRTIPSNILFNMID